jgi:hypothetical protein
VGTRSKEFTSGRKARCHGSCGIAIIPFEHENIVMPILRNLRREYQPLGHTVLEGGLDMTAFWCEYKRGGVQL